MDREVLLERRMARRVIDAAFFSFTILFPLRCVDVSLKHALKQSYANNLRTKPEALLLRSMLAGRRGRSRIFMDSAAISKPQATWWNFH